MTYEEAIKLVKEQGLTVRRPHWKYRNCKSPWEKGYNPGPYCIKPRWDGRTIVIHYSGAGRLEETFLREYVKDDDRSADDWEVVQPEYSDSDCTVCPEYCKSDADATVWLYERHQFDKWVIGHYNQAINLKKVPIFRHDSMTGLEINHKEYIFKTPIQIHIYYTEQKVVIINTRNGRCGISKCHTNDNFYPRVGVALAWARYTKEEIPDYVLKCLEER